ncbi:RNA helicase, partial [Sarracenia purpurea var. burkii]
VNWLSRKMHIDNIPVSSMHGDLPQKERNAMMEKFRDVNMRFLIMTDGRARRLDIEHACILDIEHACSKEQFSIIFFRASHYR